MINADMINEAYQDQANAQDKLYEATRVQINAKTDLDRKTADGTLNGTIAGKNAAARDASAREVLELEFYRLDMAEQDVRRVKYELAIADIEVARVRALLRLAELAVYKPRPYTIREQRPTIPPEDL